MAMDGIFLKQVNRQLQTFLPAKINRIYHISDTEILFQLRHQQTKYQLLISAHSLYNRINITNRNYPTPETPSNFIMVLRKHLEGGMLISSTQNGLDRYLHLEISSYDELGDKTTKHLYVELMGKYANVILCNQDQKIIDALKRIPPFENNKRVIQPGATFRLTEVQIGKTNPFIDPIYNPELTFTSQFEGFSPLLSKEVEQRLHRGESFAEIIQLLDNSRKLYLTKHNKQLYFHCIPLTQFETKPLSYPIMEGLDEVYFVQEEHDRIRQQTGDLFKLVRREVKKYRTKLSKLQEAYEEALASEHWKEKGELLYSYLHLVTKGMEEIKLPSFADETEIVIPLNPKWDGKQNAKKCFQKYTKGRNGKVYIKEQIEIAKQELDYFINLEYQLTVANFQDAKEIQQELVQNGYLKAKPERIRKKKKEVTPSYSEVLSPENNTIYYGKNNLQNEYLTFKKANRNDTWFHAKDVSGSHVVLCSSNPSETDIRFSAMLAAYNSSAKDSSSIPVDYCLVKDVKKIPKAKPGKVAISNHKTIYIDIDESLINEYNKNN